MTYVSDIFKVKNKHICKAFERTLISITDFFETTAGWSIDMISDGIDFC